MSESDLLKPDDSSPLFSVGDGDMPSGRVQLGEYIIEGRIGAGGMGQVYKAKQPSLDRMVALKVLPRSVAGNKDAVERFYREAKSAARLVHPNIVQIYTVGEDKGVPYFAMEYVIGEDLDCRLRRGQQFSIEESVGIAASVAMALACAGEHGIVHRDIKPANIMIDSHGIVKVMDFGLAKAAKELDNGITQAGFIVGTPTYMAPEQAEGREVDGRTDIYSLGVVFYELLCGQPPFQSDDPATLIYMHVHKRPESTRKLRPDVPEHVAEVVNRCLAKKPETRYQDAKTLLGDLMRAQDEVGGTGDDGTILFDKNMASMLIQSQVKKDSRRQKSARPVKKTDNTVSIPPKSRMARLWLADHWPIIAGAAGIALTMLTVLLVLLFSSPSGVGGEQGDAAANVEGDGGEGAGVRPAVPGKPVLALSRLRGALPDGAEIEVQIGKSPPYRVRSYEDQGVPLGPVRVTISRPHYKEASVGFEIGKSGCVPELSPDLFRLEPDEGLAGLIESANDGIDDGDFVTAKQALEGIRLADPQSPVLEDLENRLSEATLAWNQRWAEELDKAKQLMDQAKYEEADLILAKVPLQHQHYDSAKKLRGLIADVRGKIREGRVRIDGMIREGKFIEARAAYDTLVTDHRVPPEQLGAVEERLESAEHLDKLATEAERAGNHETARALMIKLREIAPQSAIYAEKIAKLDEIIRRGGQARQIIAAIEVNIADLAFDAARDGLGDLRKVDPENPAIQTIGERIRLLATKHEVQQMLGFIDKGYDSLDGEFVATLIDHDNARLLEDCAAAMNSLSRGGVRFARSRHKLSEFKLQDDGAVGDVKWEFTLDVESARRRVSGLQDLRFSFRRRPEGLRLASVSAASKPVAAFDGSGVKKDGRIQGRITSIDGNIITLDRGSAHGVKVKMMFTVYRDGRVVKMPLVDTVVVVEEEKVGQARVVEVKRNECIATFLGDTQARRRLAKGALAVQAPLLSVDGSVPALLGLRASKTSASMGEGLRIEVDARNVDGVPSYYRWGCTGGRLSSSHTTVPHVMWFAPAVAGSYEVKVTVESQMGSASRKVSVRSSGPPGPAKTLKQVSEISIGTSFNVAGDIAFDEANAAYVLDGRTARLHLLTSDFGPRSVSSPYRGRALRIRCARGHVYVLDSSGVVQRFAVSKDPFGSPPGTSYGGPGIGNGKLRRPVAFALTPAGDVAVIDAGTWTVQLFGRDGRFLASFGTQGKGVGGFAQPIAIASDAAGGLYVLDSMRGQVLAFRGGRFDGEFSVGSPDGELVDIAYDRIGDRILVLDGERAEVLAYTTGGMKLADAVRAPKARDKRSREPLAPGELAAPNRVICDGAARIYVLDGERTQVIRRYDLGDQKTVATFSGDLEANVPLTFSKMAAGSSSDLYLLDASGGAVWKTDRAGWRTLALGGKGVKSVWSSATAIACDSAGGFYVLDSALSTVHRFSAEGARVGRFGKRGDRDDPHSLPGAVDLAGSPINASLAGRMMAGDTRYVAVLLRERQFGVHLFTAEGAPRSPFPAKADGQRGCARVVVDGKGSVFMVPQSGGYVEEFNRDGLLVRRREIPAVDASGMALSPDGNVYVLDARRRALVLVPPEGKAVKIDIPRAIRSPTDVASDGLGAVYLLDGRARSVTVWLPSTR